MTAAALLFFLPHGDQGFHHLLIGADILQLGSHQLRHQLPSSCNKNSSISVLQLTSWGVLKLAV